mmetsp:Transcript_9379/g.13076  ORF Transcript_9379/g.13076 Transcript_9379/m.13076 type:complete len:199 (+) Transcript_9379:88-684(+)
MKGVVQKVDSAQVEVDGKVVSKIGAGLLVLLGIKEKDDHRDLEYVCRKVLNVRLFEKSGQMWKTSVMDADLDVLVVSQFTLYGRLKGNKPDFHEAMKANRSKAMYEDFLALARKSYKSERIQGGVFGAHMMVSLTNNGPVTLEICSDGIQHARTKKQRVVRENSNNSQEIVGDTSMSKKALHSRDSIQFARILWHPMT